MKKILIKMSDHVYSCLQKRVRLGIALEVDQIVARGTVLDDDYCIIHKDAFDAGESEDSWSIQDVTDFFERHGMTVGNRGHWLPDKMNGYNCDDCGTWSTRASRYCPDCGREMEV